ncbi:MAG TPA: phosphatidate cytidylyltransferase [Mycobacteriales bacterium]|nr:phosphatidate cytidylyltransferase [Mycobacteriales bacterium]
MTKPLPLEPDAVGSAGRAGRNLPVAIGIGLALGALVLVPLYLYRPLFLAVVVVVIVIGMHEFTRAVAVKQVRAPFLPLATGATAILCVGYADGRHWMTAAMLLTIPVLVAWRVPRGTDGLVADLATPVFALLYVGYLAGFCALMLAPPDGDRRVTCFIATVVASDVGGYAAGVLFGKHPFAPRISPKKSWEGLAGSAGLCAVVGVILTMTLLPVAWWQGVLFGLVMFGTATLGDLGESMIKRDLGIKDMGSLLPGHGGIMDRLDSLLPSALVAWALLANFAPVH